MLGVGVSIPATVIQLASLAALVAIIAPPSQTFCVILCTFIGYNTKCFDSFEELSCATLKGFNSVI